MDELQKKIHDDAIEFARKNKKQIAKRLTNVEIYIPEQKPVSVFMAGSPGAGKTEASKVLIEQFREETGQILRIDPDELRSEFDQYTGDNSWLFQSGASILVDKIHDLALEQNQSFILDGTLSNYERAEKNINRSLKRERTVQILYVYQNPQLAWEFVKARELKERRRILPNQFIDQYFAAREVVNGLKNTFQADIKVDLLFKNIDGTNRLYQAGISNIDSYVSEKYTRNDIEAIINLD